MIDQYKHDVNSISNLSFLMWTIEDHVEINRVYQFIYFIFFLFAEMPK